MTTNDVPAPVPSSLEGFPIVSATDFLRVTEQAALASARWVGQGDGHSADGAAVDAMRREFSAMPITGTVIIGEGEKDEAPELYVGEVLGTGGMPCEIAVDPLEGTNLVARGDAGAIAVCVIAAPGGVMAAPDMYMQKLCVGAGAKGRVDIAAPIADTIEVVARCYDRRVRDLSVIVLDRPRHEDMIEELRRLGVRIKLIPDGDITASMSAAVRGTGDHLYLGIGGSTEGVITAAALESLGIGHRGAAVLHHDGGASELLDVRQGLEQHGCPRLDFGPLGEMIPAARLTHRIRKVSADSATLVATTLGRRLARVEGDARERRRAGIVGDRQPAGEGAGCLIENDAVRHGQGVGERERLRAAAAGDCGGDQLGTAAIDERRALWEENRERNRGVGGWNRGVGGWARGVSNSRSLHRAH